MAAVVTPGPLSQMALYTSTFSGLEQFPLIVPQAGNTTTFSNFRITSSSLAFLLASLPPTIITTGATVGSPYAVLSTETQVLFNKTVGAASGALLPTSVTRVGPIFVKDIKGDAAANTISVTFTGGQTCEGLSTVPINLAYGGILFYPLAAGGWYIG